MGGKVKIKREYNFVKRDIVHYINAVAIYVLNFSTVIYGETVSTDTNNIYLLDLLMESFITMKKILGETIVGTVPVFTGLVDSKLVIQQKHRLRNSRGKQIKYNLETQSILTS